MTTQTDPTVVKTETQASQNLARRLWSLILRSELGAIIAFFILLLIVISIIAPRFLDIYNLGVITRQASFIAMVALGQMLVLIAGDIDLSVGSIAGLAGVMGSIMMVTWKWDPYVSILASIALGALIGLINGYLVAYVRLNAFIVTLSMSFALSGAVLVITKGWPLTGIPEQIQWIGKGSIGPLPIPTVIILVITAILAFVLKETYLGRHIYAMGGNKEAATLVGIRVQRIRMGLFVTAGTLSAIAGVMMLARLASGQPTIGSTWVMPSVTAPILGGTAMTGGMGTPLGTLLGAAIMGVIQNGIVMSGMSVYWENIVVGLTLILAIILDKLRTQALNR